MSERDLPALDRLAHSLAEAAACARRLDGSDRDRLLALVAGLLEAIPIDVTELRQTQAALARYTERLSILHEIDQAVIAAEAPVTIAEAVIRRLRDLLGVPRAIVNIFDLATGEVEWLAAAGRRRVHIGPGVRYSIRLMGDVESLRRGELQVIDVRSLPPSAETEALLASGVHVYMVVPMIAGGELIGGLSFGGAPGEFPPEQISIAQEAATQLAIAITQARLYERVKRQAEELEQRVRERTRELSATNEQLEQAMGERQRAEAEADRANRVKSEFLASMSHELRTPLNSIIGFTELLLASARDPLSDRQRTALERVHGSGKHLLALINDVLDLSKIEAERMDVHAESFAPAELVRECLAVIEPQAQAKGLRVEAVGLDTVPEMAQDRRKVQQILLNLLSNAVKFTAEGGIEVRMGAEADGWVSLAVADTGPGIRPEDQLAMFEAFRQGDAAVVRASGGTGLGLAISRRLAVLLGGTLTLESAPGRGSVFTLRVPREYRPGSPAGPVNPGPAPSAAMTILVIDDDRDVLDLIRGMLEGEGLGVEWAPSAAEGLARARTLRPAVILLDVLFRGDGDGWEVLRALKTDPATREIPVVVHSVVDDPRRAEALGAAAVLLKPASAQVVRARLRALATRPTSTASGGPNAAP